MKEEILIKEPSGGQLHAAIIKQVIVEDDPSQKAWGTLKDSYFQTRGPSFSLSLARSVWMAFFPPFPVSPGEDEPGLLHLAVSFSLAHALLCRARDTVQKSQGDERTSVEGLVNRVESSS